MPATGLKIVGTGACLPWCSISSSFQNSLKTSGNRGYEFWCWNLVPFCWRDHGHLWHIFRLMIRRRSLYRKDLDGRQANSAPGLFCYESMLLYKLQYVVLYCPAYIHKAYMSYHRTLFHFETVYFKLPLAHREKWRFWTMFTYGFPFEW